MPSHCLNLGARVQGFLPPDLDQVPHRAKEFGVLEVALDPINYMELYPLKKKKKILKNRGPGLWLP